MKIWVNDPVSSPNWNFQDALAMELRSLARSLCRRAGLISWRMARTFWMICIPWLIMTRQFTKQAKRSETCLTNCTPFQWKTYRYEIMIKVGWIVWRLTMLICKDFIKTQMINILISEITRCMIMNHLCSRWQDESRLAPMISTNPSTLNGLVPSFSTPNCSHANNQN